VQKQYEAVNEPENDEKCYLSGKRVAMKLKWLSMEQLNLAQSVLTHWRLNGFHQETSQSSFSLQLRDNSPY
jgi:hypothetical protein